MARVQFILKAREAPFIGEAMPTDPAKRYLSSGLSNSATFVADMLGTHLGHEVEVVHAIDNNCIDRLVTAFRPDIVIIEAYWVVPEKFDILNQLHPNVIWIVRNHSALPFLANEGIAIDWTLRYMDRERVIVASNDPRADAEIAALVASYKRDWSQREVQKRVFHLPNYYPTDFRDRPFLGERDVIDVGCFGATRPLKNHLLQAVAALQFAAEIGRRLRFHVNGTRVEMKGEPIVHNLRSMFQHVDADLVEHEWLDHAEFCKLLRTMDVSMQVSYTETFNIVSADAVANGVPIVTSNEVVWSDPDFQADPNDCHDMRRTLLRCHKHAQCGSKWLAQQAGLRTFSNRAVRVWRDRIASLIPPRN